nr:MAG TPA: hypothetical protein [Caudoviricetes sp.]
MYWTKTNSRTCHWTKWTKHRLCPFVHRSFVAPFSVLDKDKLEDMSLDKMDKTPTLSICPSVIRCTF